MGIIKDGFARIGKTVDHAIDKFISLILETRKGYNQTIYLFNPSGDDSVPCKGDKIIIVKVDGTGNFIGAGVLNESQGAKPGEKIFFGRDDQGKISSKLSMLNDGAVNLESDGDIKIESKKNYALNVKGDMEETVGGNSKMVADGSYTIVVDSAAIEAAKEIILKAIGSDLWCPNGNKVCNFCGAPHGGEAMGIIGLKGG